MVSHTPQTTHPQQLNEPSATRSQSHKYLGKVLSPASPRSQFAQFAKLKPNLLRPIYFVIKSGSSSGKGNSKPARRRFNCFLCYFFSTYLFTKYFQCFCCSVYKFRASTRLDSTFIFRLCCCLSDEVSVSFPKFLSHSLSRHDSLRSCAKFLELLSFVYAFVFVFELNANSLIYCTGERQQKIPRSPPQSHLAKVPREKKQNKN